MRRTPTIAPAVVLALLGCGKPDLAEVHQNKGDDHFVKGQFKAAAEEYRLSLEANPHQKKADKLLEKEAYAYMKSGDTDQAAAVLLKTMESKTDPKERVELLHTIANIYVEKGPPEKVEQYYLEALKVDPKDLDALAWLGEVASQQGGARSAKAGAVPKYLEKAIGYYDQAIALNPSALLPYVNKRIALLKYVEYERLEKEAAERDAQSAKKRSPALAEAKERAAKAQAQMDELRARIEPISAKISEMTKKPKPDAGTTVNQIN
jgi:tetratricopeptide (TPR) repeat protein